ncbi:13443_t:CDS:2 [Cetraspora pellucida]|uniref:13443_t:CDS:1 n=1 Tax=Cetraspora pellucida TaxID=1433469 RepID=A0A9N9P5C6_9GLOM|nr:13443_t:CDS:2 [Cetraspora pellucida]
MSLFDESPIDIKIETPESDIEKSEVVDLENENNIGSFIILLKIEYSYNPITSVYKITDEFGVSSYIKFDKNNQTFIDAAYNKLCEYFEPDYNRLESVYSGKKVNKKNIITYYLNDLEYSILETKYILDIIDLDSLIKEFKFKNNDVRQKILNKSEILNNDHYKNYIKKEKRCYNEIFIGENAIAKIIKRYNNQNPGTSIRVMQKIEITKRTSSFIFGFVGAPGVYQEIEKMEKLKFILFDYTIYDVLIYNEEFFEDTVQKKIEEDVLKVRKDNDNYSEFEIKKLYFRYNTINEEDYDDTKIFTFDNYGEFDDEKNNILVNLVNKYINIIN